MSDLFFRVLRHLLPTGRAWRLFLGTQIDQFMRGLVEFMPAIREYIDLVWLDTQPQDTRQLAQWEGIFGLDPAGLTDQERRDRLAAAWTALGGQSPRYIQDVLQAAGFDVYIHEWWVPGTNPPVARDPSGTLSFVTAQDGVELMQDGGQDAEEGNLDGGGPGDGYLLPNGLSSEGGQVPAPSDPDQRPYVLYFGGQTFGDAAQIPATRRDEFETLLQMIKPAQQWLGLLIEYTTLVPSLVLDYATQTYTTRDPSDVFATPVARTFDYLHTFTRSSTATYFDALGVLQTAIADEPRFDHDPDTGEPLGLLVEEERTNLQPTSDDFTGWSETNTTGIEPLTRYIEQGVAVAPDGTMTAARMTASSSAITQRIFRAGLSPATATFTHSVYMKAGTSQYGGVRFSTGGYLIVDLSTGVATLTPPSQSWAVEPAGNGWWRLSLGNFDANNVAWLIVANTGGSVNYAGTGQNVLMWGHQLEDGAFASSYIPTTGAAATRAAEAATVDDLSLWFRQGQGTLFAEAGVRPYAEAGVQHLAMINNTATSAYNTYLRINALGANAVTRDSGATQASLAIPEASLGDLSMLKMGYAFRQDDFALSANGQPAIFDSNGTTDTAQDVLQIGGAFSGRANGHIRAVRYHPAVLPASELEAQTQ